MITLLLLFSVLAVGAEPRGPRRGGSMGYYAGGVGPGPDVVRIAYRKQPLASPVADVPDSRWTEWARAMRVAAWDAVGDKGALGAFQLRAPALLAVGLVAKVVKEGAAWCVTWKAGRSEKDYLANKGLQYRALSALAVRNAAEARRSFAWALGTPTPWGPVTLSGLLAVLCVAGRKGLAGWLKRPDERVRFPNTTAAFRRGNGVF